MKAIYLDCFSGISGNMLLGAFLQAGVPLAHLEQELAKLPVKDEFAIHADTVNKNGIQAVYVDVELTDEHAQHEAHPEESGANVAEEKAIPVQHERDEQHGHHHDHAHHDHEHHHTDGAQENGPHHHHHQHRTMKDIRAMIEGSTLAKPVKQMAISIFEEVAKAEGKVHGRPADEVAFHEVGATDSIVDIVGTAICMDYLEIERVYASRLELGNGFVRCAHGIMPVPAPAVAELTKEFPTTQRDVKKELTTPTGAAVVKALATYAESLPQDFTTQTIAYGAGYWDLDVPNVLRMYIGEAMGGSQADYCILEANIDDMNPQIYGYLYDMLLNAGARDVWTTPIFMKKNRPAQQLSVLTDTAKRDELAAILFRETTTIGLRVMPVAGRLEASRHTAKLETRYGTISCKVSAWQGSLVNVSAEYEDCRRAAETHGVPLKDVQREAIRALYERLGE